MDDAVKMFCERGMVVMLGEIAVNRNNIVKVADAVGKLKKRNTLALIVAGAGLFTVSKLTAENKLMKKRISKLEMAIGELETTKG